MHITCPHCQHPIQVLAEDTVELICPCCGSSMTVDPGKTRSYLPANDLRRLGKYQLIEQVGVGAFGTVFKAHDSELDRTVAIKIPRAGNLSTQEDVNRFFREARSAAQLRHPGIVSVFDAGQVEGTCFLASEFVQGATLADHFSVDRLTFRRSAELIAAVAEAMHCAHEQGVIHRDIKPSNIMIDLEGCPHVMDFGLAKRDAGEITVTLDGQVLGTPAYMSPEQAIGDGRNVDARADVYSLGVILYQLLTGDLPFRGNSRMVILQVIQDEPQPPRRINDRIPRDLETICLKSMAKIPSRRYHNARNLAEDLRRWLEGKPIDARPVSRIERAWLWARRKPAVAGLAAGLFLSLVLGLAGMTWQWRIAVTNAQRAIEEERSGLLTLYTSLRNQAFYKLQLGELESAQTICDGMIRLQLTNEEGKPQERFGLHLLRDFYQIKAIACVGQGKDVQAKEAIEKLCALKYDHERFNELYNLACCYALCSEAVVKYGRNLPDAQERRSYYTDEAIKTLEKAVSLGFNNFEYLQQDHDLNSIREHPSYAEFVRKKFESHP